MSVCREQDNVHLNEIEKKYVIKRYLSIKKFAHVSGARYSYVS